MATPYRNVVKASLIAYNKLSEEEATKKINLETIQQLESQVGAMGSVKYAIIGISKQIGLSKEETERFFEVVVYGPENDEMFNVVKNKMQGFTEEQQLEVLSAIHDGWVKDNSNEARFIKKSGNKQLRQYAPLDLIGWNEVRSDLLFLNPILSSVGVEVNEEVLENAYHERVSSYLEENHINNESDLTSLINEGSKYYPALPNDLEQRLLPLSETVSNQIVQNWIEKDQKSAEAFNVRKNVMHV